MKKFSFLLCLTMLLFASCIQDEALNAEADIVSCEIDNDSILKDNISIRNSSVTLYVFDDKVDLEKEMQAPRFILTPGATIEPPSGTPLLFNEPQTYIVTSEDGKWKKAYTVNYIKNNIPTEYHFEACFKDEKKGYHILYEKNDKDLLVWESGNAGFAITAGNKPATDYPTYIGEGMGYENTNCVVLETRDAGFLGGLVKKPIAAGNLFNGIFDVNKAMGEAKEATNFGQPFNKVPLQLSGVYKYKRGSKFTDENKNEVAGRKDIWNIYAVLYEPENRDDYLNGFDILTSEKIIAQAVIPEEERIAAQDYAETEGTTNEWKPFTIPFELVNGKTIEPDKLEGFKYKLAIVMSSSAYGDAFLGAIGSQLMVDNLVLTCKE